MNIIILSCVFPPEPIVGAQTAISIARAMVLAGHHVTVVTSFPGRPGGKIYPGYHRTLFHKQRDQTGFEIIRCFSAPTPVSTLPSRLIENIVFGLSSLFCLLMQPRADIIYSNTWPVLASAMMGLAARLRGTPYVVRIVDLYPESILSQKRRGFGETAARLMWWLDRWIARGASHIVVLTNQFADIYAHDRGISPDHITVIPDWVEEDISLADISQACLIRRQFGIADEAFLTVYGGNIGVAAGVETVIKACVLTREAYLLVAGEGSELPACRRLAQEISCERVSFLSPWPKEQTRPLYQTADVLVLPTRGNQSLASTPSKLIRYMLSGRPVIATGLPGSEMARIIERAGCGWLVAPDDPETLAAKITEVQNLGAVERLRIGENGRKYALENFTNSVYLRKAIEIIEKSALSQENE